MKNKAVIFFKIGIKYRVLTEQLKMATVEVAILVKNYDIT